MTFLKFGLYLVSWFVILFTIGAALTVVGGVGIAFRKANRIKGRI